MNYVTGIALGSAYVSTMKPRRTHGVALLLASAEDERLWCGAFESQDVPAQALALFNADLERLAADRRMAGCRALVADAPLLIEQGLTPAAFAAFARERLSGTMLFVRLPERTGISPAEQAWARDAGIASLLPGSTVAAWQESLAPVLGRVLEAVGRGRVDARRLEASLGILIRSGDEPRPGPVKDTYGDAYHLEGQRINALRVFERMQEPGGIAVEDRYYRGRTYRQCFVASDALDWLVARFGMRRATALRTCNFLWRTGRIHHVLRDAPFDDGLLYFRFSGRRADLDRVHLGEVEAAMRSAGGVPIAERTYLAKTYPRCFVGAEAVDWLMKRYRLTLGAAEAIGQRLLELGVFHHVVDEHGFVAGKFFYRFRADEVAVAA